jgi:Protein of unknown function (DUF3616)
MPERADILTFPGICDASAAVAIDEKTIIVGDDERQQLSIYDLPTQQLLAKIPLPSHTGDGGGETDRRREADIEGATIFKGRIVWITSHGRNRSGKVRPDRHRLFASHEINSRDGKATQAFSPSFSDLASMILRNRDRSYAPLREAIGDLSRTDPALAPKKQGFNIEGLTATRDGEMLLIGVRNPQKDAKALLFELAGFDRFLQGDPSQLALGRLIEIDLGGRGIRDIAWSAAHESYIIAAGQVDDDTDGPGFALYKWDGTGAPIQIGDFNDLDRDFHPEAVVPLLDRSDHGLAPSKRILILSDEGAVPLGQDRIPCKEADETQRRFRGIIRRVD